jgi:hypothetical protein
MRSHILKDSSGGERETQRKKWLEVELEIYSCGLDEIYLKASKFSCISSKE